MRHSIAFLASTLDTTPLRCAARALAAALLVAAVGCASSQSVNTISESSGSVSSISESITDSSRSSSSSLGPSESAALQRDVETTIALVSERGGDADAMLSSVSGLCERYALIDWEVEPAVTTGMARGLAAAGVPQDEVTRFAQRVAGPEPEIRTALADALATRR